MADPLPSVYGSYNGDYPYILRVITTWGPGLVSHHDIPLSRFALLPDGTPDIEDIHTFILDVLVMNPALEFELRFSGHSPIPYDTDKWVLMNSTNIATGLDNIYTVLGIEPDPPQQPEQP